MTHDAESAIIRNDLDSMRVRIEALQAHPRYTDALNLVTQAMIAMSEGRSELHQSEMRLRALPKMDRE